MSISYTDTHCHIHDPEFFPDGGQTAYEEALAAGVYRMICIGTDIRSTQAAWEFAATRDGVYASFGIHPHDSQPEMPRFEEFSDWCVHHKTDKVVAVGEIGLDYHYNHSPRQVQIQLLERQIDLALRLDLPISFHVREAFEDFWPIFHNFSHISGVLHSFTDTIGNMEKGLSNGLYIGVNGIATFAAERDEVTRAIPLDKILLETDAPYLTPKPLRGKINVPGNVPHIASYVAELRGITVEDLARETETSASRLFF